MFSINRSFKLASLLSMMILATTSALALENSAVIEEGKLVSFTYRLSAEGEVLEDNTDKEPLSYIQGGNQILPALEAELLGLSTGDEKVVELTAANAYGEHNADRVQEVPLEQIPESSRVVGTLLQSPSIPGPILVAEIREDVAVLDTNHPLAGKDLTFEITIVAIEDAPAPAEAAPAPPTT
jgi:FKBP-type peptidyl-prolyl cis-trans isomerase 2